MSTNIHIVLLHPLQFAQNNQIHLSISVTILGISQTFSCQIQKEKDTNLISISEILSLTKVSVKLF